MRFAELQINEYETFQSRTGNISSSVGYGHGGAVAKRGGSQWQQAQADANREYDRRVALARSGGVAAPGGAGATDTGAGTDAANTTDPDAPNNPGSDGQLRFGPNALTTLNGQQSRMTNANAGRNMEATLARARRMAGFFGSSITINDAIARSGTSREHETQGSQHFQGRALDISTSGMSNQQKIALVRAAQRAGFTGFGFGSNILHVDTGPRRHWAYGNSSYGGVSVASLGQAVRSNRLVGSRTAVA